MKRPRCLMHRLRITGEASLFLAFVDVPIADGIRRQPREWRRAAAWLRKVADWWEFLAEQQEAKEEGR